MFLYTVVSQKFVPIEDVVGPMIEYHFEKEEKKDEE